MRSGAAPTVISPPARSDRNERGPRSILALTRDIIWVARTSPCVPTCRLPMCSLGRSCSGIIVYYVILDEQANECTVSKSCAVHKAVISHSCKRKKTASPIVARCRPLKPSLAAVPVTPARLLRQTYSFIALSGQGAQAGSTSLEACHAPTTPEPPTLELDLETATALKDPAARARDLCCSAYTAAT